MLVLALTRFIVDYGCIQRECGVGFLRRLRLNGSCAYVSSAPEQSERLDDRAQSVGLPTSQAGGLPEVATGESVRWPGGHSLDDLPP